MATDADGRLARHIPGRALHAAVPGETVHALHTHAAAAYLEAALRDAYAAILEDRVAQQAGPGGERIYAAAGETVAADMTYDDPAVEAAPGDSSPVKWGHTARPPAHPDVTARVEEAAAASAAVFGSPDQGEVAEAGRCPPRLAHCPDEMPLLMAGTPGAAYWAWRHVTTGVWIARPGERHAFITADTDPSAPVATTAAGVRQLLAGRGLEAGGGWPGGDTGRR